MNLNELSNNNFSISICGENVEVNKDSNVKETLKTILEDKGINSFAVFIDGEMMETSTQFPETFEGCEVVEVRRAGKAGMDLADLAEAENDYFEIDYLGSNVRVGKTDGVADTLKGMLERDNINSFSLVIDGSKIENANDIPETFEDCETVSVMKFVKAGN